MNQQSLPPRSRRPLPRCLHARGQGSHRDRKRWGGLSVREYALLQLLLRPLRELGPARHHGIPNVVVDSTVTSSPPCGTTGMGRSRAPPGTQ